jgi:hypothetical protein
MKQTYLHMWYPLFEIINMLEFLIDNRSVIFGGRVFQQTVGIPMPWVQAVLHLPPTGKFTMGKLKSSRLS